MIILLSLVIHINNGLLVLIQAETSCVYEIILETDIETSGHLMYFIVAFFQISPYLPSE